MCFVSEPRIEATTRDRGDGGDLGCVPQLHTYNVLGRSAHSYPHTGIQGESLLTPAQPDELRRGRSLLCRLVPLDSRSARPPDAYEATVRVK